MVYLNIIIPVTLLLAIPFACIAQVYKWVDEAGIVHYSEIPQPNAVMLTIQSPNKSVMSAQSINPTDFTISAAPDRNKTMANYSVVMLEYPKDQDTIQNTGSIAVSITTPLAKDDRWQVLIDGKVTGEPKTSNQFTLENIERGEHKIQVQIIDIHGTVLASSAIITLYVHQAIISTK